MRGKQKMDPKEPKQEGPFVKAMFVQDLKQDQEENLSKQEEASMDLSFY